MHTPETALPARVKNRAGWSETVFVAVPVILAAAVFVVNRVFTSVPAIVARLLLLLPCQTLVRTCAHIVRG